MDDSWKAIADRLKERFPTPPKVLIRLVFALYQDGYKKRDRKEIEWAYWEIEGLPIGKHLRSGCVEDKEDRQEVVIRWCKEDVLYMPYIQRGLLNWRKQ